MSLRTKFRSFLLQREACKNGKARAFGFSNLMAAFNGISDRNLRWFLNELSYSDGVTQRNADRLERMVSAMGNIKDGTDDATDRRIYNSIRSRRNYRFVKTQFNVVLRNQEADNS